MTISDGLPVQFWGAGCNTYNQTVPHGVFAACYNQTFGCDDEIRLQVSNNVQGKSYSLRLVDNAGETLTELPFEETQFNKNVPFSPALQFTNPDFTSNLNGWNSFGGSDRVSTSAGAPWSFLAGNARCFSFTASKSRYFAAQRSDNPSLGWPPGNYQLRFKAFSNGGSALTVKVFSMPNASNQTLVSSTADGTIPNTNVTTFVNVSFTLSSYTPYLAFTFDGTAFTTMSLDVEEILITAAPTVDSVYNHSVYDLNFVPSELSPEICGTKVQFIIVDETASPEEVAYSDFVEIKPTVPNTLLIRYSNARPYAGIDFQLLAEGETFALRIPAIFFHERFPGEGESLELSRGKIVNVNGVLRSQRLLDSGYMPYYLHRKIQLILNCQYLEIDGHTWTKQEAYEIQEGLKRHPLKRATCWLTDRGFVARNVI